ncbi:hypothetical protein [Chryseobacterium sp.]|uniref:hypothetical protein n=1 Tax=Chryseobacterium sp. TaxID=1871047 RepID=UPI003219B01C
MNNKIKTWQERFKDTYLNFPIEKIRPSDQITWMEAEITELRARIESLASDAERWKVARQFIAIEDIENWFGREWRGHRPNEEESVKADQAIDAAIASQASKGPVPAAGCHYLMPDGRVCNKCGQVHRATQALQAAPSVASGVQDKKPSDWPKDLNYVSDAEAVAIIETDAVNDAFISFAGNINVGSSIRLVQAICTALASQADRGVVIPEGWQWVPKKITYDMERAASNSKGRSSGAHQESVRILWEDMLAAAPKRAKIQPVADPVDIPPRSLGEIMTADSMAKAKPVDLPVVLELPEGDNRVAHVVWQEIRDGKRHLCITVNSEVQPVANTILSDQQIIELAGKIFNFKHWKQTEERKAEYIAFANIIRSGQQPVVQIQDDRAAFEAWANKEGFGDKYRDSMFEAWKGGRDTGLEEAALWIDGYHGLNRREAEAIRSLKTSEVSKS